MIEMKYLGVGLTSIGLCGAAIAIGAIFSSLLNAVARNPDVSDKLQKMSLLGAGFAEMIGLLSFVLGIMLINA